MQQYLFSNSSIDLACEEVGTFLASADVERREALRLPVALGAVLWQIESKNGFRGAAFGMRLEDYLEDYIKGLGGISQRPC